MGMLRKLIPKVTSSGRDFQQAFSTLSESREFEDTPVASTVSGISSAFS